LVASGYQTFSVHGATARNGNVCGTGEKKITFISSFELGKILLAKNMSSYYDLLIATRTHNNNINNNDYNKTVD
jgi:hypothetical protein